MSRSSEARHNREAAAREREQLNVLARAMSAPAGRQYFRELLFDYCGIANINSAASVTTLAHLEGLRDAGLKLAGDLQKASIELYFDMIKEAVNSDVRYPDGANGTDTDDTSTGTDDPDDAF